MLETEVEKEKLYREDKEDGGRYLKFIRKETGVIQGYYRTWTKFCCYEDLWKRVVD